MPQTKFGQIKLLFPVYLGGKRLHVDKLGVFDRVFIVF